ncbi:type I restriction endonuclease [Actinomadura sp. NPDC000929]|uniref:Eco57I restriction-modification methylase domain-containing protein n=1 Tax=Actinomadura sp. NPDC000929 TaxID=3154517 RepID=UPI0033954CFE
MKADSKATVRRLVERFAADFDYYTDSRRRYLEADARSEFIDPLLRALGWDIENQQGLTPSKREVVREESQQQEDTSNKRPDYTLRVDGVGKLYVEAKKPSVDVLIDMEAIRQTRAYGWTKQHPIAVLTNFRHVRIFDTSVPIGPEDTATTALKFECDYQELVENWDKLECLIGREAVHAPDWLKQFMAVLSQAPLPADQRFVQQFNKWRLMLGESLVAGNATMTEAEINDAVQRILNRLVFVRMCEDRGIEGEGVLRDAFNGTTTDVVGLFKRLNDRYNTGIFRTAGAPNDPVLMVSATVLKSIVDNLYAPLSPFSFAVLDANFLGLVYEASLAEHLAIIRTGGCPTVRLNKKREYAKRDVVTTPQELVTATIRAAVDNVDVDLPKTLDFAVGSGRFLVSVFDALIEREVIRRTGIGGRPGLLKVAEHTYRLAFKEKRRLLVDYCFGIDIDFNAVEVARFSLLVRLLEDERRETLPARERSILPDLSANIAHGNTLVRAMPAAAPSGAEEVTQPIALAQVGLPVSFDLIVGNPPYMSTEQMKLYDKWEFAYIKREYTTSHQQFDKYFAFVEFAVDHLNDRGVLGVVIPNKWMTIEAGPRFRAMLRSVGTLRRLVNFRHVQVFENKSIYICSLVVKRAAATDFEYAEPDTINDFLAGAGVHRTLSVRHLPEGPEEPLVLPADANEERVLAKIRQNSIQMKEVVEARNGVQTSLNSVYVITNPEVSNGIVEFTKSGATWRIEEDVTRPYLDDSTGVRSHFEVQADALIVYPYQPTSAAQNLSGFEVIPEADMREQYPLAYKYLTAHRALMDKRNVPSRERAKAFYVYGRVQAIGYCTQAPKIFYSTNQRGGKYGLDTVGIVYQSGGTAGEIALYPRNLGYSLDFVLALLDQRPIEFFLRKRGSAFRDGYVARGTAVMNDVPVPRLDFNDSVDVEFHNDVASKMVALRNLHAKTSSTPERRMTQHRAKIDATRLQIEDLFLARWDLAASVVAALRL